MPNYPYITVTQGLAGYFAVKIWLNPDGRFEEPYDTGDGRYALQLDAISEARDWAELEGLRFVEPMICLQPARQDVEQQIKELIPGVNIIKIEE